MSSLRWFVLAIFVACMFIGGDMSEAQASSTTPGIDISHHQGIVDWSQVRSRDARFVFVRVSDGLSRDSAFRRNWRSAREHGLIRGAYQFFRPQRDPVAQADLLVARAPRLRGDLPPALDIEDRDGVSARTYVSRMRRWISRYRERSGHRVVIIYTRDNFWRDLGSPRMPGTILWVARYGGSGPSIPATWSRWLFWQHSETGRISGISGDVDLNHFNGSFRDLRALARID